MSSGIPRLPYEIEKASEERRLILFLGTGISCYAGLRSWDEIKKDLICKMRLCEGDAKDIKDQFKTEDTYDCFALICKRDKTIYEQIICNALKTSHADLNKFKRLLNSLISLNPISIVTTNIDNLLHDCGIFIEEQFRYTEQCNPHELRDINKDKNVKNMLCFCIHGNPKSSIFNTYDLKIYDLLDYKSFLYNIFGSYIILFVGFSFRDKKLLECAKLNQFIETSKNYHYALLPNKRNGQSDVALEDIYGVRVLSYRKDKKYSNFEKTILSWRKVEEISDEDLSRSNI